MFLPERELGLVTSQTPHITSHKQIHVSPLLQNAVSTNMCLKMNISWKAWIPPCTAQRMSISYLSRGSNWLVWRSFRGWIPVACLTLSLLKSFTSCSQCWTLRACCLCVWPPLSSSRTSRAMCTPPLDSLTFYPLLWPMTWILSPKEASIFSVSLFSILYTLS